jgi:hypothetical protein
MEIIVRKGGSESDRRKREAARAIVKHYYEREIRDGSRFKTKAGTKEQIRRVYEVR